MLDYSPGLQPLHIIYVGIALLAILTAIKVHDKWQHRKQQRKTKPKHETEKSLLQ